MNGPAMTSMRLETLFWILLLGGLLAGIGFVSDWGRRWIWPMNEIETVAAPFEKPQLAKPFVLPAPDAFIEIAMRPLFLPTRRPAPTLPESAKQSMKRGQFILTGTTIVGDSRFAHLIEKIGGKPHVIAAGKDINGILVKLVEPTHIILEQHGETEVVPLQVAKAPPAQDTPKPPAPSINRRKGQGLPPASGEAPPSPQTQAAQPEQ